MTRDEAERLAKVFRTVDGGCNVCIEKVCEEANRAGLGFYFALDDDEIEVLVLDERPPAP